MFNELAKKWDFHEEKLDFFPHFPGKKKRSPIYNQTLHTDTTGIQRFNAHTPGPSSVLGSGNPQPKPLWMPLEYILGPKSEGVRESTTYNF